MPLAPTRLRLACLAALAPALCAPSPAQAEGCGQLFAGGQPPALLNPKLAQRTTLLCNEGYAALASGVTRGPPWSAERLTAGSLAGARATARQGRFHEEERLPPGDRATLPDHARSGYDRGHMAPSGDMPGPEARQQGFSLANTVPQAPALNRGAWEGIEGAVRRLALRHGEPCVVTGPAFQGSQLQSLRGRVLVPTSTWKAAYDPQARGMAAYMCANASQPSCTTVSVAALALAAGVDPFPAAPESMRQAAMRLPPPAPSRHPRPGPSREGPRPQRRGLLDWLLQ